MPGSNCETLRQICGDLGIILVFRWSYNYSEWSNYCQWLDILGNQVCPVVQMLLPNDTVFRDRQFTHTHTQKCSVLVWGAWRCTSAPSLASTITTQVPSSIISPATKDVFMKSGTVFHNRLFRTYMSIPRRIQTVLQANGDPTPF